MPKKGIQKSQNNRKKVISQKKIYSGPSVYGGHPEDPHPAQLFSLLRFSGLGLSLSRYGCVGPCISFTLGGRSQSDSVMQLQSKMKGWKRACRHRKSRVTTASMQHLARSRPHHYVSSRKPHHQCVCFASQYCLLIISTSQALEP